MKKVIMVLLILVFFGSISISRAASSEYCMVTAKWTIEAMNCMLGHESLLEVTPTTIYVIAIQCMDKVKKIHPEYPQIVKKHGMDPQIVYHNLTAHSQSVYEILMRKRMKGFDHFRNYEIQDMIKAFYDGCMGIEY